VFGACCRNGSKNWRRKNESDPRLGERGNLFQSSSSPTSKRSQFSALALTNSQKTALTTSEPLGCASHKWAKCRTYSVGLKSLIYVCFAFHEEKTLFRIFCLVLFSINIGLNGQNYCDIIKSRMFLLAYCNI
jgi:hypothetical protein